MLNHFVCISDEMIELIQNKKKSIGKTVDKITDCVIQIHWQKSLSEDTMPLFEENFRNGKSNAEQ